MSEFRCPKCGATLTVATNIEPKRTLLTQDVKAIFPKELEDLLTFEENQDYIILKTRRFLGSENFAKIAAIVRANKGEYVSAGKDSHFKIPKAEKK